MPVASFKSTTQAVICYHCGEDCPAEYIQFDDRRFCCQGCKMVYEILNSNDLCAYYNIDENAGVSLKGKKQQQYAYLDEPDVLEKLLDFTNESISKVTLYLPQIHCASCIWLLENLWKLNEYIRHSRVNFLKKELYLTFDSSATSLRAIVELLSSIGYAPAINLGSLEADKKKVAPRKFYYQLGVAGFAFGNIMLLSFPEYLGLEAGGASGFRQLFGYLNIVLAIPVLFYSGQDYLRSAWSSLKVGQLNLDVPIALGMLMLFGRSSFEILSGMGAGYMDSLAGLIFFLLIGKWFQQNTYHHLSFERDYKSYFPIAATVLSAGKEKATSLQNLQAGDTILIKHGELIPADGILIKGAGRVDYSFVTGEAEPVAVNNGEKVYAGGRQMGAAIQVSLVKKVSQSYLTQLWNDEAFTSGTVSKTQGLADVTGRRFTRVVLTIAALTLLYWWPKDPSIAFNAFTAVLIIACPCAVALSIPFTLGNILRIFSSLNFYLKNTAVIEHLNDITAVVFDKTGTLTSAIQYQVIDAGPPLMGKQLSLVTSLLANSNHPLSQQLYDYLPEGEETFEVVHFKNFSGKGIRGCVGGHEVAIGSASFLKGHAKLLELQTARVYIGIDGVAETAFNFSDPFRQGFETTIQYFQNNYTTYLLSGDSEKDRSKLAPYFSNPANLHFNQSPQDKLDFINTLSQNGEKVMMIGDGLNDAGALRTSQVGLVITEDTNNFTPASDAILDARHFQLLPKLIALSKKGIRIVYWAYLLAFCYNVVGLSYAVSGNLSPVVAAILMPLSSVTIVLFGVGMSTLAARRMGLSQSQVRKASG